MTALAVMVFWAAYTVRKVLIIVYVSVVLAIGFSPIVRIIERQKLVPIGEAVAALAGDPDSLRRASWARSRWCSSLIFPPLVEQAQALWAKRTEMFERGPAVPDRARACCAST